MHSKETFSQVVKKQSNVNDTSMPQTLNAFGNSQPQN